MAISRFASYDEVAVSFFENTKMCNTLSRLREMCEKGTSGVPKRANYGTSRQKRNGRQPYTLRRVASFGYMQNYAIWGKVWKLFVQKWWKVEKYWVHWSRECGMRSANKRKKSFSLHSVFRYFSLPPWNTGLSAWNVIHCFFLICHESNTMI